MNILPFEHLSNIYMKKYFHQFLSSCENVIIFPIFHIFQTANLICAEKCEDCAGGEEVVLCRSVDSDEVDDHDQVDDDDDHHHHEAVADVLVQGRVG